MFPSPPIKNERPASGLSLVLSMISYRIRIDSVTLQNVVLLQTRLIFTSPTQLFIVTT